MEYDDARRRGDEGERLVAEELERLSPRYGLTVLNGIMLKVGPMTAQVDHVLVDRYGVVLLETKVRQGATIRGSDVQKSWTACYPGGRTASFQNPLMQNREHENAVRQALREAGRPLEPDYVKSAVVLVGADLTQLELDSLSRLRVVDVSDIEALIAARHDFALNAGDLSAERVAEIAGLLRGLDRSGDRDVAEAHAAYREGRRPAPQQVPVQAYVPSDQGKAPPRGRPAESSRYSQRVARGLTELLLRLVFLALVGAGFWWLFIGPGQPLLMDFLLPGSRSGSLEAPQPSPVAGPTVGQALAALQEFAPDKYAALANRDDPQVTQVPQGTTFSWEYVEAEGNAARVGTVAITLDASGQMVGADFR